MPAVYFQTYGCQMNVADSDELARILARRGYSAVATPHEADIIVVNTCSVREHAEERARARITEFAAIKRRRRGAALWVVGCMAERLGERFRDEIPGVDLVIGARAYDHLEELIDRHCSAYQQETAAPGPVSPASDFVPVMRGCNNYCSYCIVPYVRGPEQSIGASQIESEIRSRVAAGAVEIMLLGQNVNSYNDNGIDFPDLLKRIAGIDGLRRFRFTTSHPKDCTAKLIDTIASQSKLCNHLHLPVQSGSDRILSKMNRSYTADQYLRLVELFRKALPHGDISTDVLVGFPSESEQEFEQTLDLVKAARFTTAFMFAYSPRSGTESAKMHDSVTQEEKMGRLRRLIELQTDITRQIYQRAVGTNIEVMLFAQQEKRERMWMGQDSGFKRVLLSCSDAKAGMILNVRVARSSGMTLIAERIV